MLRLYAIEELLSKHFYQTDVAKATTYDVAERAGVSISTVSLALNGPDQVNAATHSRVMLQLTHLAM